MNNLPDNPQIQVLKAGNTSLTSNYIFKAIPLSFDESMSYYETLCGLLDYLKNVIIPTVNNNADAVAELQTLYEELKSYVDNAIEDFEEEVTNDVDRLEDYMNNYFNNLDVQQEINNKLDDMVEQGTLQEIIADYLNSKAIFGYDTVADMKISTNLINGSYAQTMGYHTKNDGGNSLYKIRSKTVSDVIDEALIIAMSDNTLVAELIVKDYVTPEQFGAYGDNTHDDTTAIQNCLNHSMRHSVLSKSYKTTSALSVPSWKIVDGGGEIHTTGTGIKLNGVRFVNIKNLKIYANQYAIHVNTDNNYCAYNVLENLFCTGNETSGSKGLYVETTNYYCNEFTYRNCVFWNYDYGIYATDENGQGSKEMSRHSFQNCSTETSIVAGQYVKNGLNFTFYDCRTIEGASNIWITEGTCYHFLIIGGDAWFVNNASANFSSTTNGMIVGALRNGSIAINNPGRTGYIVRGKIVPDTTDVGIYRKEITQDTTIAYGDELFKNFTFKNTGNITFTLPSECYGGNFKISEFYVRIMTNAGDITFNIGSFTKTISGGVGTWKYYKFTFNTLQDDASWFIEEITTL